LLGRREIARAVLPEPVDFFDRHIEAYQKGNL
jgi:hypothetical protein